MYRHLKAPVGLSPVCEKTDERAGPQQMQVCIGCVLHNSVWMNAGYLRAHIEDAQDFSYKLSVRPNQHGSSNKKIQGLTRLVPHSTVFFLRPQRRRHRPRSSNTSPHIYNFEIFVRILLENISLCSIYAWQKWHLKFVAKKFWEVLTYFEFKIKSIIRCNYHHVPKGIFRVYVASLHKNINYYLCLKIYLF